MENSKRLIITIIVILILVLVLLFVGGKPQSEGPTETDDQNTAEQNEGTVSRVELESAEGSDRLPEGFPSGTPVEVENLVDSFRVDYENSGTETTVIYRTSSTLGELMEEYRTYMTDAGYEIVQEDSSTAQVSLLGRMGDDTLSFAAMELDGEREVFVSSYATN